MFVTDISVFSCKIGCANIQLKIKTVKSIRNRYLFLVVAEIGSTFILSVSNFARQRLNSFVILALVSLFVKVFHAIAPLKRMEFLIKFVSGLGRMMFSILLRPEFLCKNKSLNSVTV